MSAKTEYDSNIACFKVENDIKKFSLDNWQNLEPIDKIHHVQMGTTVQPDTDHLNDTKFKGSLG